MSVTFSVANPKIFFIPKRILSVDECLALCEGIIQTNLDEITQFDNDLQAFYRQPLNKISRLHLAHLAKRGRGFELSFYDDAYHVKIETPATVFDWQLALSLLQCLTQLLGRHAMNEVGEVFSAEEIALFDYRADILSGLRTLYHTLDGSLGCYELSGVMHPMAFDSAMMSQILISENPAEYFSELFTDNQDIDAYFANPIISQQEGNAIGVYMLNEDLPTILPHQPTEENVDEWRLCFYAANNEQSPIQLPYQTFIDGLTIHDYEPMDAKYILVYSLPASRFQSQLSG